MNFTDKQIEKGFWYYDPENNFPPNEKLIDEYEGDDRLSLTITKGNESDSQIKKREKQYSEEITSRLKTVKVLWAYHINQDTFDSICNLDNLEALYVESNRIKDISSIKKLNDLEHLALLNFTKLDTISPLQELTRLKSLKLEHLKNISDFSIIGNLSNLEGLQIEGSMYTAQQITNFDFITALLKLRYLTLINTKSGTKDFTSLTNLLNLEMFQCSTNYPKLEFQKLNILPALKYIGLNIKDKIKNES